MVSLEIFRMTSDVSNGPHTDDWHNAEAEGVDMMQHLGLPVAVSDAVSSVYVDAVTCCDTSTINNNHHSTDPAGSWHSQHLSESHEDSFEHSALNGLLDVSSLINTNTSSLQFGILPSHYSMWSQSDFDTPHHSELLVTPQSHSQADGSIQSTANMKQIAGGNSSKLPNIESLMNLTSGGLINVPLTGVSHGEGTSVVEEVSGSMLGNEVKPGTNRNRGRKYTRKNNSANVSTNPNSKKCKQEASIVKIECDEPQLRRPAGTSRQNSKRSRTKESGSSPERSASLNSTRRESSTFEEFLMNEDLDGDIDEDGDDGSDSESLSLPNISNDGTHLTDGSLQLTNEECALLEKEGVRLPLSTPLSKEHERVLKRVRRKIRNKISAKNSRLKKQEYVEGLERRVRTSANENTALQRRVRQLEKTNESLLSEITQMRNILLAQQRAVAITPTPTTSCPATLTTANANAAFAGQNDSSRARGGRPQAATRVTRSLASAAASESGVTPQNGALPPISTLSPSPKGKLLLMVAFSFAFVFLPIFGVQLRRPALFPSATSNPLISANPFGGASRVLLAAFTEDNDVNNFHDDAVDFHRHMDETTRSTALQDDSRETEDDDDEIDARRLVGNVVEKSALDEALEANFRSMNLGGGEDDSESDEDSSSADDSSIEKSNSFRTGSINRQRSEF